MKSFISILFLSVSILVTKGQDMHFSQYFAAPILTNPANSGFFKDDWRIGGNYKNQWPWGSEVSHKTYRTVSGYGDMGFFKDELGNGDWVGIGAVLAYDKAGDGDLSATKIFVSGAYHKSFGFDDQFYVSLGVGGGFVQKTIDYTSLYFDNQWNDSRFDVFAPKGEPHKGETNTQLIDINAGLKATYYSNEKWNISFGTAFFHVNKPKDTFYEGDNRLGIRPLSSVSAQIEVNNKTSIFPSVAYMSQKRASELLVSTLGRYDLKLEGAEHDHSIWFGAIYRYNDAISPLVGYEMDKIRILLNYDINHSSLSKASRGVGGFELSLVYTGLKKQTLEKMLIPCPRM